MLNWEEASAVYLFTRPVDIRSRFDRLAELEKCELGRSPLRGGLFVFISRNRRRAKILFGDKDGFWLLYERLKAGVFHVDLCDILRRLPTHPASRISELLPNRWVPL